MREIFLFWAQATATVTGTVLDPDGGAVAGAKVRLVNPVTGFSAGQEAGLDGGFRFTNLPLQGYLVKAEAAGFGPSQTAISVRSNIPVAVTIRLALAETLQSVSVSESDRLLLADPQQTASYAQINRQDIDRMPLNVGNRGLEAVLVTLPGFAQNANGAIHPRGAHNQMTYVIDGMPISDQLTGAFANAVDPSIVQTVELYTSNIPAEYGNKVSAVANITTKSGLGTGRRFSANTTVSAAQFDTLAQTTQAAGERGKLGYSVSLQAMETHRYLDQVALDNWHNGGHSTRGFTRIDYLASAKDSLRFNVMAGASAFELANLRSQQANGMDQRQALEDYSALAGWVRTLGPRTTLDSTGSLRTASARLLPSAGDTPVTAWQSRRLATWTFNTRLSHQRGGHQWRAGADFQRFPVQEQFTFGGGGFAFRQRAAGTLSSAHVQDNVHWRRFQFSLGLRYDQYRFLSRGNQWQPRVGLAFHLKETGTVLRASYNRNYQIPPNENLLLSSSNGLGAFGRVEAVIRPERQNFYEAGLQQPLLGRISLNASFYHKDSRDQQDNNNFLNTGIIFPTSLERLRVNGVEGRLVFPEYRGFSGSLSATHAHAVATPPFTGGLFIGNDAVGALSLGPFVIDHDQKLSLHAMLNYVSRRGFYSNWSIRHDSGLVVNPSDPLSVAADPDFRELLPYVDLGSNPPRARPRTITDVAAGYARSGDGGRRWEVALQVSNIANRTALYNFQSLFVGTRLVQPRTAGIRLRWYWR